MPLIENFLQNVFNKSTSPKASLGTGEEDKDKEKRLKQAVKDFMDTLAEKGQEIKPEDFQTIAEKNNLPPQDIYKMGKILSETTNLYNNMTGEQNKPLQIVQSVTGKGTPMEQGTPVEGVTQPTGLSGLTGAMPAGETPFNTNLLRSSIQPQPNIPAGVIPDISVAPKPTVEQEPQTGLLGLPGKILGGIGGFVKAHPNIALTGLAALGAATTKDPRYGEKMSAAITRGYGIAQARTAAESKAVMDKLKLDNEQTRLDISKAHLILSISKDDRERKAAQRTIEKSTGEQAGRLALMKAVVADDQSIFVNDKNSKFIPFSQYRAAFPLGKPQLKQDENGEYTWIREGKPPEKTGVKGKPVKESARNAIMNQWLQDNPGKTATDFAVWEKGLGGGKSPTLKTWQEYSSYYPRLKEIDPRDTELIKQAIESGKPAKEVETGILEALKKLPEKKSSGFSFDPKTGQMTWNP